MRHLTALTLILSSLALASCGKKPAETAAAPAPAPAVQARAPAPAPVAETQPPAEPTAEQRERARKQALLEYGAMEDQYLNDARAQWASSAKASSTFGDQDGKTPSESSLAKNVIGPVDGKGWTNNHQDIGFDWLELGFDKPVSATEVRAVFADGVEAVNKVELQDTDGRWFTVWSGLSEIARDERGSRTWFVRSFEKTAYKVKAVKITLANNVERGYKEVDAVQLVGD